MLRAPSLDRAAAIAFWAFFSIFPLLMGALSLVGFFLHSSDIECRLYETVTGLFPAGASLIQNSVETVISGRGTLSVFGTLGLIWSASKGFGAMTRAVNATAGIERPHPALWMRLRYFLMTLVVSILLILSVAIPVSIDVIVKLPALAQFGLDDIEVSRLQGRVTSLAFVFVMFTLIYKVTPWKDTPWRQVVPGALVATVLFELGKSGFVFFLERVADLEAVYGSISSIIVLLLWLYFSSVVLLLGAEYNVVRWRVRSDSTAGEHGGIREQ